MVAVWREKAQYLPMHELIWQILQETGYYIYIASTEDGDQRSANLDLLLDRALAYEEGSYKGLFHFMRYLARMEEKEHDEIQAGIGGDEDNVVHIMSIHKSKGLEYPVVFVGGLGHEFNRQDLSGRVLLHPELYIGAQAVTADAAFHYETLPHRAIIARKKQESIAEEMRVLYGALTRAKEKLIISGAYKPDEIPEDTVIDGKFSSYRIRSAGNYLDWLAPLIASDTNWVMDEIEPPQTEPEEEAEAGTVSEQEAAALDAEYYRGLDKRMAYRYPNAWKEVLPSRLSVSQLKKTGEEETFSEKTLLYTAPEEEEDDRERDVYGQEDHEGDHDL